MKTKLLILSISISWGYSTILNVPADYPTIQAGIDASVDGDTVLIEPGTYDENWIRFWGKNIVVTSSGTAEETIIDGNNMGCPIVFSGNETNETILSGFTIQNGEGCVFGQGGGIYIEFSSPTLQNLIIRDNYAYIGGGIFINMNSHPVLENLLILNNNGVGIQMYGSSTDIQLINSTITGNSEGGILIESGSASVVNSILWDNSEEEIYNWIGSVNVFYSDIQGGWDGEGNIDADPLFFDSENGDFTLQEDSPCIDAGPAFFVWEGDTLVDMSPDEYIGSAPDMGAFEFGIGEGLPGDVNTDGDVNVIDVIMTVIYILNNEYNELADLNGDGDVDIVDILLIVNIILEE